MLPVLLPILQLALALGAAIFIIRKVGFRKPPDDDDPTGGVKKKTKVNWGELLLWLTFMMFLLIRYFDIGLNILGPPFR